MNKINSTITKKSLKKYYESFEHINQFHRKRIYHCDLHTDNILYDNDSESFKFIDFGISLWGHESLNSLSKDARIFPYNDMFNYGLNNIDFIELHDKSKLFMTFMLFCDKLLLKLNEFRELYNSLSSYCNEDVLLFSIIYTRRNSFKYWDTNVYTIVLNILEKYKIIEWYNDSCICMWYNGVLKYYYYNVSNFLRHNIQYLYTNVSETSETIELNYKLSSIYKYTENQYDVITFDIVSKSLCNFGVYSEIIKEMIKEFYSDFQNYPFLSDITEYMILSVYVLTTLQSLRDSSYNSSYNFSLDNLYNIFNMQIFFYTDKYKLIDKFSDDEKEEEEEEEKNVLSYTINQYNTTLLYMSLFHTNNKELMYLKLKCSKREISKLMYLMFRK